MVKIIIIDDEQAAINSLVKKIELYCSGVQILATCSTAKEGIAALKKFKPDVLFLDIEMPWMNGFDLLNHIGEEIDFKVVFTTAYDKYAVQAIKIEALDYLLKPIDKDDLIQSINKARTFADNIEQSSLNRLINEVDIPQDQSRVLLYSKEGIEILKLNNIMYCKAQSNYTYVYTEKNRKIVVCKTLSNIEAQLNSSKIVRTHKTYLVNLDHVTKYSTEDGGNLLMGNEISIPVSRRKKESVLAAIAGLSG